ncbi:MAG: alpha/beta fold hydrolase [Rhodobacteraceae bacterium]|nr:alpha/beta fold hydrolase [Paracoccaceae bacterium]
MPRFTTSDGLSLYYSDTGPGTAQPILCLPGLTRCSRDFEFYAQHAVGLRMIALDYRGRGQSDYDPDYSNYNVPKESLDVIELLDHLGLDKVTILGTSRGGLIAMVLAATHKDRVAGVILNDVGPVVGTEGIGRILTYVGKRPVSKTLDQAGAALKNAMEAEFPGVTLERWQAQAEIQYAMTPEGLELRYDPQLRTALMEQIATGETPDLWPVFDALAGLPLGVIRGANSDVLETGTLTQMKERNPAMHIAIVPDRGHVPFLDEPEAVALINQILEQAK